MRNIKLTLEYDGSRYNGWQRQGREDRSNTIEYKLTQVIDKMTGEQAELFCGSRTETGVHAYAQVVNFKTACRLKTYEIKNYINQYLPMDIAILTAEEQPERFHASLNAKSRTYLYRISIGDAPNVFNRKYTYYCFKTPNLVLMRAAAQSLLGKHDFQNFSTVKKKKSTEKEITELTVKETNDEIQIRITANDFLHNMPRMIASTLLDIGLEKRPPEDLIDLLHDSPTVKASFSAEAKGLFLEHIEY